MQLHRIETNKQQIIELTTTVVSVLQLEYTDCGHIALTKHPSDSVSYSCFVTPLPTRDPSSTGLVITEYITNSLKLTLIHITQHVDSSLHTWDGYLSKSTLM
eukprot:1122522_1